MNTAHPTNHHPAPTSAPSAPLAPPAVLPLLVGLAMILLLPACETPGEGRTEATAVTVRMPQPANDAEARFIGDIGSALRTRGWQPAPAARVPQATHELRFAIRGTAAGGFSSRIELLANGRQLAIGEADAGTLPAAMGELALVFDESLAAFQRSLARVPLPSAPAPPTR